MRFSVGPVVEMSWWATYRVQPSVNISSPTDISDRKPRSSSFVMDCENDDEVTFIEEAGHAAPLPCSGSRPPLARLFKRGQTKVLDDLTLVLSTGNVERHLSSFRQRGFEFYRRSAPLFRRSVKPVVCTPNGYNGCDTLPCYVLQLS